jgi:glycosyltransferase involved in cell wall biosynthesis
MSLRVFMYCAVEPADRGGVQAVYRRLGGSLKARGHRVVQAWSRPDPHDQASRVHALPPPALGPLLRHPRKLAGAGRAVLHLCAALARFRPQVVNCHFLTAEAWYFVQLKRLFGYRLVLSAHGSDVLRPKPWNAPWIGAILAAADAVTAVSRMTADRLDEKYDVPPERLFVIPNGIDTAFWSAGAAVPAAERPPVVLSVGRLHPVKGHDILLDAFASVASRMREARLVIVGDGGCQPGLELQAERLGIAARVTFAGAGDAAAVRDRLGHARCFVLPSRSEGLPLALLEAMAAGTPVVATRVGGVPEVTGDSAAVLVAPEDPVGMAAAIERLLGDARAATELAVLARERAEAYTAAASDDDYERVFGSAAGAHNFNINNRLASRSI